MNRPVLRKAVGGGRNDLSDLLTSSGVFRSRRVCASGREARRHAWWALAAAFLAQNAAIGLNFAVYGTIVTVVQANYGTSRALAASGLAVMTLTMGLLSPLVGALLGRFSIRGLMLVGAALNMIGYLLLSVSSSIYAVLAIYGFVIGPGVSLLGVVPSSTLVSNWFAVGRGRALGFISMPAFMSIFPFVTAMVLGAFGLRGVFLFGALAFAALMPVLLSVVTRPGDIGLMPFGAEAAGDGNDLAGASVAVPPDGGPILGGREILASRPFQIIWMGIGLLTAGGVMITVHLVPIAIDKGLDVRAASILLSVFGLSGSFGALMFGWMADRIGGANALATQALAWIFPWTALILLGPSLLPLLLVASCMGLMSGAIVGLLGVITSTWLGPQNLGRALGYVYLFKIPFMFGAAPLAGLMVDHTGSYTLPLALHITSFLFVGLMFLLYRPAVKQGPTDR